LLPSRLFNHKHYSLSSGNFVLLLPDGREFACPVQFLVPKRKMVRLPNKPSSIFKTKLQPGIVQGLLALLKSQHEA